MTQPPDYTPMSPDACTALLMKLYQEGQQAEFDGYRLEALSFAGTQYVTWLARCNQFVACTWADVDMYAGDLQQNVFQDCRWGGVVLRKADLNGCTFVRCVFTDCNFTRADLIGCTFETVTFTRCDFSGATLCRGVMRNVTFEDCTTAGSFIGENDETEVLWRNSARN